MGEQSVNNGVGVRVGRGVAVTVGDGVGGWVGIGVAVGVRDGCTDAHPVMKISAKINNAKGFIINQ
jgi:hypothetical protein